MIKNKKHAYLIMAHNNYYVLEKQIQLLDNVRNDIYVHIDLKVKDFNFDYFLGIPKESQIFFVERTNVYWGHYSQIKCEIILLKEAIKRGYEYYHLLSGADLPLKSQEYIHNFFDKNYGKEFVHVIDNGWDKKNNVYQHRISKYHFFIKGFKNNSQLITTFSKVMNRLVINLQKFLKVNRMRESKIEYYFGSQWFSITHYLADYILSKQSWIEKHFKYTLCSDEIFLQTILLNSDFSKNLVKDNLRLIDWKRGEGSSPYVFKTEDFNELIHTDKLFARKFDENVDKKIVDLIYNQVVNEKNESNYKL